MKASDVFWSSVGRGVENSRFKWYDLAARKCFEVIDGKIQELNDRMSSGDFLSNEEQFLLGKLNELKMEIADELREGEKDVQIP